MLLSVRYDILTYLKYAFLTFRRAQQPTEIDEVTVHFHCNGGSINQVIKVTVHFHCNGGSINQVILYIFIVMVAVLIR